MRKVFKPENVVKKEKTVKIPDVEFINDTTAQADDSEGKTVLTEEVYNKILEKVLNDNSGEIGRRRLKAAHERDVTIGRVFLVGCADSAVWHVGIRLRWHLCRHHPV